jgi:hypothetical protein
MRRSAVKQIWRCPNCGYRATTPLVATAMGCPRPHARGGVMKCIWDITSGLPIPEEEECATRS